jgi:hypothetical protein
MDSGISGVRFAVIGVLLCAMAMQTYGATITVTSTNDSGSGSLRQALASANDGDTINFAVTGTIGLTSGGLLIAKNVTISGPGADQLSIDGNQALFVFGVFPDKIATISGVSIRNGQSGIWNALGTLAVSNCVVSLNSYGGLYNDHGALTVSNCVITGNSYFGIGSNGSVGPTRPVELGNDRGDAQKISGDHASVSVSLTVANSIVSGNSGPGVYNDSAPVTIVNSTLTGNSTGQDFGYGGGISSTGRKAPAIVMVTNSTISGNSAFYSGGGIASYFSSVTIVSSTISGNSAGDIGGGIAGGNFAGVAIVNSTISGNSAGNSGGGIFNGYPGHVVIANSTLGGNSAASGGGIYNDQQPNAKTLLEISNTILNAGASGENIYNNGGTVTSHGYNLSSDDGGGYLTGPGDQINTDPLLGPLQDNGGPTLTHVPLPGSPAIDAGDPNFTPPPLRDQRGPCFHRLFGHRIDIGSVETQPQPRCPTPRPRPTPPR